MNNCDYSIYYTASNPGLWVLLTDESEESISRINRFIYACICHNQVGHEIKRRCYIHIIGYNGIIKKLLSGYLPNIGDHPLELIEKREKKSDGEGGFIDIHVKIPIWCKPRIIHEESRLINVLDSIQVFLKEWILANPHSPAPVVYNICSEVIDNINASAGLSNAIDRVKSLQCRDGEVLFVNVFASKDNNMLLNNDHLLAKLASNMPKSHVYRFRYIAKYGRQNYNQYSSKTLMNFNIRDLEYLVIPIMGWSSEPLMDEELFED